MSMDTFSNILPWKKKVLAHHHDKCKKKKIIQALS